VAVVTAAGLPPRGESLRAILADALVDAGVPAVLVLVLLVGTAGTGLVVLGLLLAGAV
jgi:hypothetical protein